MALWRNNAEGQSSGTAVTAANVATVTAGSSGDPFNAATIGGTSAISFSSTQAQKGSRSYKLDTVAGYQTLLSWQFTDDRQVVARAYLYLSQLPAAGNFPQIIRLASSNNGTGLFSLALHPSGYLTWVNYAGAATNLSGASFSTGQWYRIEVSLDQGTTTSNGTASIKVCTGANIDTDAGIVAAFTTTLTGQNFGGASATRVGSVNFGKHTSAPALGTMYFDGLGVNQGTTTFLGPSVEATTLSGDGQGIPSAEVFGTGTLVGGSTSVSGNGLWNTAEGGTDQVEVSIANSGGASGDPFNYDVLGTGVGATIHYTDTSAASGTFSYAVNSGSSNQSATYLGWDGTASNTVAFSGCFMFPTGFPALNGTTPSAIHLVRLQTGGTMHACIAINSNGAIIIGSDVTGTNVWQSDSSSSANRLQTNTWYRFDWSISNGAGVGVSELKVYSLQTSGGGGGSSTPEPVLSVNDFSVNGAYGFLYPNGIVGTRATTSTPTTAAGWTQVTGLSSTLTGQNFGSSAINRVYFGRASTAAGIAWPTFYMDNLSYIDGAIEPPPVGNPLALVGQGIPSAEAFGFGTISGMPNLPPGSYEDLYTDVYGSYEETHLSLIGLSIESEEAFGYGAILIDDAPPPPPPPPPIVFPPVDEVEVAEWDVYIREQQQNVSIAQLTNASKRNVTFNLTQPSTCSWSMNGNSFPEIGLIDEMVSDTYWVRNGTPLGRFRTGGSSDSVSADKHTTTFNGADYRSVLDRRYLTNAYATTGTANGKDQYDIVSDWINLTQAESGGSLGIVHSSSWPASGSGVLRWDRWEPGTSIGQAISEMGSRVGVYGTYGYDWDVGPELDIMLWNPARGAVTGYTIQYGGNCVSFERRLDPSTYANDITFEWTPPGGVKSYVRAVAENLIDNPPGGLWQARGSGSWATSGEALQAAQGALAEAEGLIPGYVCKMKSGTWDPNQCWLGDNVQLVIRSGRLNVIPPTNLYRVQSISIDIDDDGAEEVTITLGSPLYDISTRLYLMGRAIQALERR